MRPLKRERLDAAYRYMESLSPEMLAFELMRRNDDYRADWAASSREPQDPPADPEPDHGRHWGLRCPRRPRPDRLGRLRVLARRRARPSCTAGAGA